MSSLLLGTPTTVTANDRVDDEHDHSDDDLSSLSASPAPSEFSTIDHEEVVFPTVPTSPIVPAAPVIDSERSEERVKLNPHPRYFFEDGNLLIRVEDVDFRIHRYFFMRDSRPFRELSEDGVSGRIEGGDNAGDHTPPLVLHDVKRADFECFLSILYPTHFNRDEDTTSEYWASVLTVSSHLEFQSIRTLSVEKLSAVANPVDKIALGRKFDVTRWLSEAYYAVCMRREAITKEEGRKLGVDELVDIMQARQCLLWEDPQLNIRERRNYLQVLFNLTSPRAPPMDILSGSTSAATPQPETQLVIPPPLITPVPAPAPAPAPATSRSPSPILARPLSSLHRKGKGKSTVVRPLSGETSIKRSYVSTSNNVPTLLGLDGTSSSKAQGEEELTSEPKRISSTTPVSLWGLKAPNRSLSPVPVQTLDDQVSLAPTLPSKSVGKASWLKRA